MTPRVLNLLRATPKDPERSLAEETIPLLDLPRASNVRLEHLVSHGQASPPGFWYDQPEDEWVMLLQGTATLAFETDAGQETLDLIAGDALTIPARLRHRVASVSPDAVWLALHFGSHA
jgi:cupin 2 domain-containing protein